MEDGLLEAAVLGAQPNATGFTKPKCDTKGSLIVDMVPINDLCKPPHRRLRMPTLEQLTADFQRCAWDRCQMWMSKIHVSNMFWSSKLPAWDHHSVRVVAARRVYGFRSLTFGGTHSPVICGRDAAAHPCEGPGKDSSGHTLHRGCPPNLGSPRC